MEAWKARVYASYYESTGSGSSSAGREAPAVAQRQEYIQRYRRFLPSDAAAPVLDIGCGTGRFLEALRSIGHSCVEGVDVSPSQVDAATARGVTGITLAPALDYLRQRRGRYAMIAAFNVLEHQTREELFELLDTIRDALVPGGSLIAVVPNAKGLFGAHVRFADITHELSFAPISVSQICAVTGFELTAVVEHGPLVHGVVSAMRWAAWQVIRSAMLAARLAEGADWQWPVFTQDLVFVARKPLGGGAK